MLNSFSWVTHLVTDLCAFGLAVKLMGRVIIQLNETRNEDEHSPVLAREKESSQEIFFQLVQGQEMLLKRMLFSTSRVCAHSQ